MQPGRRAAHSITLTFLDFRFNSFHKLRRTKGPLIAVLAAAHGDFAGLFFSCAEDQHIWDLLQLGKANLSADFVGTGASKCPDIRSKRGLKTDRKCGLSLN